MSKGARIWFIIGVALVILGGMLFSAALLSGDWNFEKLSSDNYVTNTYEIDEETVSISVIADTADIVFLKSDDGKARVICYESENVKHSVSITSGVLNISFKDNRKWYEHISLASRTPKITVYLPKEQYSSLVIENDTGNIEIPKDFRFWLIDVETNTGDVKNYASASDSVKIKASTGDITTEDISAATVELSVSTGMIYAEKIFCSGDIKIDVSTGRTTLNNVSCKNLVSTGNTGDISLNNVVLEEKLYIERTTGDVSFDDCDAAEIIIKTDTGSVKGSLRSEKIFIVNTDTGRVNVPKTTSGGKCEITTDTGDISITVNG